MDGLARVAGSELIRPLRGMQGRCRTSGARETHELPPDSEQPAALPGPTRARRRIPNPPPRKRRGAAVRCRAPDPLAAPRYEPHTIRMFAAGSEPGVAPAARINGRRCSIV